MNVNAVCKALQMQGDITATEQLKAGHINTTYRITTTEKDYILQAINTSIFKNPVGMMENIYRVTQYITENWKKEWGNPDRLVLHYCATAEGVPYVWEGATFYRAYEFVKDSVAYDVTEDMSVIEEGGKAFGEFQRYLADYPADTLNIVIPEFHNTVNRYRIFEQAISDNKSGRKNTAEKEITAYRELRDIACKMAKMQQSGALPLRVTHNDTKTNNVLFDKVTGKHLAVIDLDTIMPGLCGFDFGDAIRYIANTCAEDEKDTNKVALDLRKFEAFAKGFVGAVGKTLSDSEKETMALGAISMTAECGVRFLSDYLDGDTYFKTDYPEHNLVRAKCQLKLAQDMVARLYEMNAIVRKYL